MMLLLRPTSTTLLLALGSPSTTATITILYHLQRHAARSRRKPATPATHLTTLGLTHHLHANTGNLPPPPTAAISGEHPVTTVIFPAIIKPPPSNQTLRKHHLHRETPCSHSSHLSSPPSPPPLPPENLVTNPTPTGNPLDLAVLPPQTPFSGHSSLHRSVALWSFDGGFHQPVWRSRSVNEARFVGWFWLAHGVVAGMLAGNVGNREYL